MASMRLRAGTRIRLYGLRKAKSYNGCDGVILERGEEEKCGEDRVPVRITTRGGRKKKIKVRERNIAIRDDANESGEDASLMKRIYEFSRSVDPREILLDGVYKKMLDPVAFRKFVFPFVDDEADESVVDDFPKSLVEMMEDPTYRLLILSTMPHVREKSKSILEGTKRRAAMEGDSNPHMASVYEWQIMLEAFGRALIRAVQMARVELSRKRSVYAQPSHEYALCNQLDRSTVQSLREKKIAVQDDFFGADWVELIRSDVDRFCALEAKKFQDACAVTGIMSQSLHRSKEERALLPRPKTATLRSDCGNMYPALGEVSDALSALPFELNKCLALRLSIPNEGDGTLTRFGTNGRCCDPWHIDSENKGVKTGVRISCIYYPFDAPASYALKLKATATAKEGACDEATVESVVPRRDRLVLFRSDAFYRTSETRGDESGQIKCREHVFLQFLFRGANEQCRRCV